MNAVLNPNSGVPSMPPSMPPEEVDEEGSFAKPWMIAAVAVLVLVALGWWAYKSMGTGHSGPKRQTVKIAVLPDTPPPPPPKEEKKPEPEKQENKPQQQEQPKPVEAPPEQQIKMDGPAGDGPSAFAAGQVNSEYKGGDVGSGLGGGTVAVNKMQFAFFTSRLTRHIQSELAKRSAFKGIDYKVNVRVWLSPGGDFQRIELGASTGDENTDRLLKEALSQMPSVDKAPADMPQPLTLRITNRMTG